MACVDNYLWSKLSSSFDCIEQSFVGIQLPEPPLDDSSPVNPPSVNRLEAQKEVKFQIYSRYADYLLNLSLPFLHYALRLGRLNMQREMSSYIHYDGQRRSLSTALEGFSRNLSRSEDNLVQKYNYALRYRNFPEFKDTINGPNEAWLCVYGNDQGIAPYAIQPSTRGLGYVFWDSPRLREAGFMHLW